MSELQSLSYAEQRIALSEDVAELKEIYDFAEAYRVYAKKLKDQNQASTIKLRAASKGGAILANDPEFGPGKPARLAGLFKDLSEDAALHLSSRWQRIAEFDSLGKLADYLAKAEKAKAEITVAGLLHFCRTGRINPVAHVGTTEDLDEWFTPSWLSEQLDVIFDIDVCAPTDPELRTIPARRYLTLKEDGLATPWQGLVWCNPPYSNAAPWIERWQHHDDGLLLTHVSVKSLRMPPLWWAADAIVLFTRMDFERPGGITESPFWILQLAARGSRSIDLLSRIDNRHAGPVWVAA
jgi:hypothetical protein